MPDKNSLVDLPLNSTSSFGMENMQDENNTSECACSGNISFLDVCDHLLPYEIVMNIFEYLSIHDLARARIISRTICKFINEDEKGVLWHNITRNHTWLFSLFENRGFIAELGKRKHKWMRFLSIFADNVSEWETEPNFQQDISSHMKLFANREEAKVYASSSPTSINLSPLDDKRKKQTLVYLPDSHMNVSCAGSYDIKSNTVKYFEVFVDEKENNWNVGVGLAEKAFLLQKRKFVGFNSQNFGYSSNGFIREFSSKVHKTYQQQGGFPQFGMYFRL